MNDAYTAALYDVVKETQTTTGYSLPETLEAYLVMLLAAHVDKPHFLPIDSFAQSYLNLHRSSTLPAKQLGDTCLFVSGVFPTYGSKHGISRKYYQDIGVSSYEIVAETMNGELFSQLADHFTFLSDFIKITIHNPKQPHYKLYH